jgi:MFS family permease
MSKNSGGRAGSRALDWLNFSLADVQTGVGPFLAAALTAKSWNPAQIGTLLTFGGLLGIGFQTPAGAVVDATHRKRALIGAGILAIVVASLLLAFGRGWWSVALAQTILGAVGPFIGPAVMAITLGLVGKILFDARLGRNRSFDAAGNVCAALLMGWVGWRFGTKYIFLIVPLLSIPAFAALAAIPAAQINYWRARGADEDAAGTASSSTRAIFARDRILLAFLIAAFLFHFANAAMLPQLGELLSRNRIRSAAPFMAAAVTVTQFVIALTASTVGRVSARRGPRPLLLLGFAVLPIRGVLYTLTSSISLLVAIQILDGVANSIFGIASAVLVADRTRGSGHFNLAMGAVNTAVGVGAAMSNIVAGLVAQRAGFQASFLVLSGIALIAFLCLMNFVPNTRHYTAHLVAACAESAGALSTRVVL